MALERLFTKRGHALLVTLAMTALLLPLGSFAIMQARVDLLLARHARKATELFYVAESGLEHALADIRQEPSFARLLQGPDGIEDTLDDACFPFRQPPPSFFPAAPFRYEVTVKQREPGRVDVVSQATGRGRAVQTVSASVLRSPTPFITGAACSAIDGSGFAMGSDFHVSGLDSSRREEALPAIALPDEEAAARLTARVGSEKATQLEGRNGAPSVDTSRCPELGQPVEDLVHDPSARTATVDETGELGSGLLVSRGALFVERASGNGILVVEGDFHVSESFDFEGVVIVLGDVVFERDSQVEIHGALIQTGDGQRLELLGTGAIAYDSQIVAALDAEFAGLLPHRATVAGWQQMF